MTFQLFRKSFAVKSFEYKIKVPKTIAKIPKYCVFNNTSSIKIKENIELNIGDSDKRGIVRLSSD